MKKWIFAAALIINVIAGGTASLASAGTLNLDMRLDYLSTTYKDTTTPDTAKFGFKTGRLDYQGTLNEDIHYRARIAFTKNTTVQGTDKSQQAVEFAYLTHKTSDQLAITLGKLSPEIGGFEGSTSSADLYLTSEAYTRSINPPTPPTIITNNELLYMTGAKATWTFLPEQKLSFVITDKLDKPDLSGPADNQNSNLFGVIYRGGFQEKTLHFNLSYHTQDGAKENDRHQFYAAGVMWRAEPISLSVDYLVSEFKEDASGHKDSLSSAVVKFAYTGIEYWTPRADLIFSEQKNEIKSQDKTKYTGFGLALEYAPYSNNHFRYHVAYTNTQGDPDVGPRATREDIIVGTRILADILK